MPVYFIQAGDDGPVKIGWANDVAARRKALQTSHHEPLRLLRIIEGRRQTERWLHECFAGQRMAGEWFWFHTDMATIEPPEFGPATPPRPTKARPQKRVSWNMCWAGDPCLECRAYASGNRLQYLYRCEATE